MLMDSVDGDHTKATSRILNNYEESNQESENQAPIDSQPVEVMALDNFLNQLAQDDMLRASSPGGERKSTFSTFKTVQNNHFLQSESSGSLMAPPSKNRFSKIHHDFSIEEES